LISAAVGGVFTYSTTCGSMPAARIIASTRPDVVHFGLCQMTTLIAAAQAAARAPQRT
jgi:hypothetical protein